MKQTHFLLLLAILVFVACPVFARDRIVTLPLNNALESGEVRRAIYQDTQLYWGDQHYPGEVKKDFGEFKVSQRTAIMDRPREDACEWALAGAIKKIQEAAIRQGANAVINISSANLFSSYRSAKNFDCSVGGLLVMVALKGNLVALGPKTVEPPQIAVKSNYAQEQIVAVQKKLFVLGYNPGEADGIVGELLRKALAQFQADNDLRVTGEPDTKTVDRLLAMETTVKRGEVAGTSDQDDVTQKINRLYALYKDGAITEEEFTLLKEKALERYSLQ